MPVDEEAEERVPLTDTGVVADKAGAPDMRIEDDDQPAEEESSEGDGPTPREQQALELSRLNAEELEQARGEVQMKERRIADLTAMVEELEAGAGAGGQGVAWDDEKVEMREALQGLKEAVAERDQRVEELEEVKTNLQESYEARLEEKEIAIEELRKEADLVAVGLRDQIDNLKLSVADQKGKGADAKKAVGAEYEAKMDELREQQKKELAAKEAEVAKVRAEKKQIEDDAAGSAKTIKKL